MLSIYQIIIAYSTKFHKLFEKKKLAMVRKINGNKKRINFFYNSIVNFNFQNKFLFNVRARVSQCQLLAYLIIQK